MDRLTKRFENLKGVSVKGSCQLVMVSGQVNKSLYGGVLGEVRRAGALRVSSTRVRRGKTPLKSGRDG